MKKNYELCINGVRIRKMEKSEPRYVFEKWSCAANRWIPIRINDKLHNQIINRDK